MSLLAGSGGSSTRGSFSDLVALVLILCPRSASTASEKGAEVLTVRWLGVPASCNNLLLPVGKSLQEHRRAGCPVAYAWDSTTMSSERTLVMHHPCRDLHCLGTSHVASSNGPTGTRHLGGHYWDTGCVISGSPSQTKYARGK